MDEPRTQRFLIVENDARYAAWIQHAIGAGWPNDSVVVMDWSSFGRVRTAMTVRDYDIVLLAMAFDEGIEEPTTDSLDWSRRLRSQPGFPEMIILAEGGSELAAVRTLRLGAADYLPKRLLTPARLHRSIKLTLRAIEKEALRRAERQATAKPVASKPDAAKPAAVLPAPVSPVSTHTGASLAKAAAIAVQSATTLAVSPAVSPASTHTGAHLAAAA
jgi:DNA-binding response OmpR family regulator